MGIPHILLPQGKSDSRLEQILPTNPDKSSPWEDAKDSFETLDLLKGLDEGQSLRRWKLAQEQYSKAWDLFHLGKKEADVEKEKSLGEKHYEDRYDWQKKARVDKISRDYQKKILELRNESIRYLAKAMNQLDEIQNPKVIESINYIDLKASIYREYIKHQEALQNYIQLMDFCERYIQISETQEKEKEPHRLLALSYEKMEQIASKNKDQEAIQSWKEKKKKHSIRFAELHYGKDSIEFKKLLERLAKDF